MSLMRLVLSIYNSSRSILIVCMSLFAATTFAADNTNIPLPTINIENGDKCVEPTDIMRTKHMEFILHQRDETMHKGLRTKQHSLKNCINCHANPETKSVLGKDGFCESCHAYAAVKLDCFECHSSAPEELSSSKETGLKPSSPLERLITSSFPLADKEQSQ